MKIERLNHWKALDNPAGPLGAEDGVERKTGFEPATLTLAR